MPRGRPSGSKNKPEKSEGGVTKKGSRKTKDPNAPKRGLSAFFIWLNENRDRIKKEGMGVAEVAKAAGEEWGKMTDKAKWEKLAAEDKKRYEKEMAVYKAK